MYERKRRLTRLRKKTLDSPLNWLDISCQYQKTERKRCGLSKGSWQWKNISKLDELLISCTCRWQSQSMLIRRDLDKKLLSPNTWTHVALKLNVIDSHYKTFIDPVHKCGPLNTICHFFLLANFLGGILLIRTLVDCCQKMEIKLYITHPFPQPSRYLMTNTAVTNYRDLHDNVAFYNSFSLVPIGTSFLHRLAVVITAWGVYYLSPANPSFWRVNTLLSDKSYRILLESRFCCRG